MWFTLWSEQVLMKSELDVVKNYSKIQTKNEYMKNLIPPIMALLAGDVTLFLYSCPVYLLNENITEIVSICACVHTHTVMSQHV